jgi:hypothetical protein
MIASIEDFRCQDFTYLLLVCISLLHVISEDVCLLQELIHSEFETAIFHEQQLFVRFVDE